VYYFNAPRNIIIIIGIEKYCASGLELQAGLCTLGPTDKEAGESYA
jgi:hypothetical protein